MSGHVDAVKPRLTMKDIVEMFGTDMPPEVVNLFWTCPDHWTRADFDREVRRLAAVRIPKETQDE